MKIATVIHEANGLIKASIAINWVVPLPYNVQYFRRRQRYQTKLYGVHSVLLPVYLECLYCFTTQSGTYSGGIWTYCISLRIATQTKMSHAIEISFIQFHSYLAKPQGFSSGCFRILYLGEHWMVLATPGLIFRSFSGAQTLALQRSAHNVNSQ